MTVHGLMVQDGASAPLIMRITIRGEDTAMPINYDELMALKEFLGQKFAYGDREVMLYAYGIGMGADFPGREEAGFRQ